MTTYGVSITVRTTETTEQGTKTTETKYNFHVSSTKDIKDLVNETVSNATVSNLEVTEETAPTYTSPFNGSYRKLSDSEILGLLLTK